MRSCCSQLNLMRSQAFTECSSSLIHEFNAGTPEGSTNWLKPMKSQGPLPSIADLGSSSLLRISFPLQGVSSSFRFCLWFLSFQFFVVFGSNGLIPSFLSSCFPFWFQAQLRLKWKLWAASQLNESLQLALDTKGSNDSARILWL